MAPIRVLQIVPAMNAGGMETFIMNIYRAIDREKVQFDFALTEVNSMIEAREGWNVRISSSMVFTFQTKMPAFQ